MRRERKAKIVPTSGPASRESDMLEALFERGADVFRLNFSHGSHEDHQQSYERIRAMEVKYGRSMCILADIQGPKLRLGTFAEGSVDVMRASRSNAKLACAGRREETTLTGKPASSPTRLGSAPTRGWRPAGRCGLG